MQVGDRDLGGRDQVQLVAGDDVHLVFLVGDLARAACALAVLTTAGGQTSVMPVLAGVDVEEPVDERTLEGRPGALVDREAGARDLRAAGVVEDAERLAELPVRLAGPAVDLVGQDVAPGPDGDVGLFATDRDVRVGRVRDAQELVVEGRLGRRELRVEGGDAWSPAAVEAARRSATSGPSGGGTGLDRLADPLRGGVAFRLERLALGQQAAPLGVELERAIDQRRVLALADRPVADEIRLIAEPLQADAHAAPPEAPAAARSRSMTNDRVEAGHQPAGARSVGPSEERGVDRAERPPGGELRRRRRAEDRVLPRIAAGAAASSRPSRQAPPGRRAGRPRVAAASAGTASCRTASRARSGA